MWNDQYSEAYRISAGITKPITRKRVHEIARVLSYNSEVPEPRIPNDVILAIVGDLKADPLEARVNFAIGWAIQLGFIKQDPTNPEVLILSTHQAKNTFLQ